MTLIELLVAASILSLALAPILDLLAKNSRQTRFSGDRLYATMRARMVLERYRAFSPERLEQMFPGDGSGSSRVAADSLVSLAPTAPTSDPDLEGARRREAGFAVVVTFLAAKGARAGQLVARVNWSSPNGSKTSTYVASEWVSERSR